MCCFWFVTLIINLISNNKPHPELTNASDFRFRRTKFNENRVK